MKVKELIEALQLLNDPESEIVFTSENKEENKFLLCADWLGLISHNKHGTYINLFDMDIRVKK